MKCALYSDCHTEMRQDPLWFPQVNKAASTIVLAGDIGVADQAIQWVSDLAALYRDRQIVYVAGNHEFYRTRHSEQLDQFKRAFEALPNVHFLENTAVVIQGVRFLGCTLWTEFNALGVRVGHDFKEKYANFLYDFRLIRSAEQQLITPAYMASLQRESVDWLTSQLREPHGGATVVVTHFPPTNNLLHGLFGENEVAAYFLNDLQALIEQYRPAMWCYGHNHWNEDLVSGGTHIVSNQLGYPAEDPAQIGYREQLLLDV